MISAATMFVITLAAALFSAREEVVHEDEIKPPHDAHLQPRPFPEHSLVGSSQKLAWILAYMQVSEKLLALIETRLTQVPMKSLPWWRMFWKLMVRKVGAKGAVAAILVGMDGPLPVGDLIAAGLTVWMMYDMYLLIDVVVDAVNKMESDGQLQA